MQACTSICNIFFWLPLSLALLAAPPLFAAGPVPDGSQQDQQPKEDKTQQSDEEDFSPSPYAEYGEFNEEEEESNNTKFLQYGRLFGVSIGVGFDNVTGNRGSLWRGGFPLTDFKVIYWYDFNIAMDLGLTFSSHNYDDTSHSGPIDVNMLRFGLGLRYYIDTKNLSAPISFANPYLLLGAGLHTKNEYATVEGGSPDRQTAFGVSAGAGLEFAIKPRKTYFALDGTISSVRFNDTSSTAFAAQGIPNLEGYFYNIVGHILFTW